MFTVKIGFLVVGVHGSLSKGWRGIPDWGVPGFERVCWFKDRISALTPQVMFETC